MFKRKRGIKLSYYKQGFVYFWCANYSALPMSSRRAIQKLCDEVAGADSTALLAFLTKPEKTAVAVSMQYFISEKKLYSLRARFYEEFWKRRIFEK